MMLYRLRCMRLTLLTTLSFAGGPGAGVWEGQRCGYRGRSCRRSGREWRGMKGGSLTPLWCYECDCLGNNRF